MPGPESLHANGREADAEDVRLMRRVSKGESAAFEELIERHQALVSGTVARMLGNNADVDDVAQQVFLRVWKNASRYVPRARFTTWLLTITRNLVFNELRRRRRHASVPLQTETEGQELQTRDEQTASPDVSLLEGELQKAIESAIGALPENQRLALILRRYEELSYEDIADVLEQSVPAVKSLLFRARTELRERLKSYLAG